MSKKLKGEKNKRKATRKETSRRKEKAKEKKNEKRGIGNGPIGAIKLPMYSGETARVTADGTQIVVDTRTDHELMLDFKYGTVVS